MRFIANAEHEYLEGKVCYYNVRWINRQFYNGRRNPVCRICSKKGSKANAENICKAITDTMEKVLNMSSYEMTERLVAAATDGVAVMLGSKNGVVARLKEDRKWILGIHCMAHWLELAFKHVMTQKANEMCFCCLPNFTQHYNTEKVTGMV